MKNEDQIEEPSVEKTQDEILAEIAERREEYNRERLEHRNAIADQIDSNREEEFNAELDNGDDAPAEVVEDIDQDEPPVAEQEHKSERPKIKVNGVEMDLTDELIAKAQKIASADEYLRRAKLAQPSGQDVVQNPTTRRGAGSPVEDIDYAEVATALTTGTTEEIQAALKQMNAGRLSDKDVFQQARAAIEFEDATKWFVSEYKDILGNEYLKQLVQQEDDRLRADGFEGNLKERFAAAGEKVRGFVEEIGGSRAQSQQEESPQSKKDRLPKRPATASKRIEVQQDDEGEENPASVIANMAKARRGY